MNTARFDGGAEDPIVTTDHRASNHAGGQLRFVLTLGRHQTRIGAFGFSERDSTLLGLRVNEWSFKLTAVNLFDKRYLLDQSNTFGGTHYNDAREVSIHVDRRFGY